MAWWRPGKFGAGGWGLPPEDPALKARKLDWLREAGLHLMERATYEEMAGFWPVSDDEYAKPMNEIPKLVFSRTLTKADWPQSTIASGDLADEINALKREPGKDLIAWGGAAFAQSLNRLSRIRNAASCKSGNAGSASADRLHTQAGAAVLDEAASALLPAVDVLAFASTSSGYALGYDEEIALVKRLRQRWEVPVYAASLSAVSALRARHVKRISLVHPPWFGAPAQRARRRVLPQPGLRGRGCSAGGPSRRPESDRAGHGRRLGRTAPTPPRRSSIHWRERLPSRSRRPHLERRTGRLVLEATQVLLWSVLENAGAPVAVRGFGMLFDDRQPDRNKTKER
jgi:dihydrofolate reductase